MPHQLANKLFTVCSYGNAVLKSFSDEPGEEQIVSDELYDDHILDHFESPCTTKGTCPVRHAHSDRNPISVTRSLELAIDDQRRVHGVLRRQGCAISQAAASILCEAIEGQSLDGCRISGERHARFAESDRTASRQKCGLLGFKILKTILYSLERIHRRSVSSARCQCRVFKDASPVLPPTASVPD